MGITIFTSAPIPPGDAIRSEAALQSGLLKRIDDPILARIARETRHVLRAAWAGVVIMVNDTQHVIASSRGMLGIYRRSTSLSSYVINAPTEVFVVLDAAYDERFAGNPFVADGLIRFFAGTAIFDRARHAIGVLCVTDRIAHDSFTADQAELLARYADEITATLP
jgi:GAF domain-containing protein